MTNYRGIDYSGPSGTCNRDIDLGIRYGVISQLIVLQAWSDSSEPDYGAPHCHYCGNECFDSGHCDTPDFDDPENADIEVSGCGEYYCDTCRKAFDGEYAYGDPIGYVLDDGEYKASCGDDGDIFVIRSPFYTHAQFCSPCAPGAGHLGNPCPDGPKTFCFGHDWFDGGVAPYPVYSVETGELVLSDGKHLDWTTAQQFVAYVVDDAGSGRKIGDDQYAIIRQGNPSKRIDDPNGVPCYPSVIVCFLVDGKPVCCAVHSYLDVKLDDTEASDMSADYLAEIGIVDTGTNPDFIFSNYRLEN